MKKKILIIITLSELGGAQKIVYYIAESLHSYFDITVICGQSGELVQWLLKSGIKVVVLNELRREIGLINDMKAFCRIYKFIRSEKFDLVHCHSWKAGIVGRLAAKLAGVRNIFFTVHGWSLLHSKSRFVKYSFKTVEKVLAIFTTKIICVCDNDREQGLRENIAGDTKLVTIYNGIEDLKCTNSCDVFRRSDARYTDAIIVGTVARMAKPKQPIEAIRVFTELLKKGYNIYYIWVGDGPLLEDARSLIKSCALEDRVILAGSKADIGEYLLSFDVLLLISEYEGLPVSVMEAMSAGLPVIASDVGGIKEEVIDGINGYVVEKNDLNNFAVKMERLIRSKSERELLGSRGRDIFLKSFTKEKMAEAYKKLYEEAD